MVTEAVLTALATILRMVMIIFFYYGDCPMAMFSIFHFNPNGKTIASLQTNGYFSQAFY